MPRGLPGRGSARADAMETVTEALEYLEKAGAAISLFAVALVVAGFFISRGYEEILFPKLKE